MLLGIPDQHPYPLDRGTDPEIRIRIRIRTKCHGSTFHNTGLLNKIRGDSVRIRFEMLTSDFIN